MSMISKLSLMLLAAGAAAVCTDNYPTPSNGGDWCSDISSFTDGQNCWGACARISGQAPGAGQAPPIGFVAGLLGLARPMPEGSPPTSPADAAPITDTGEAGLRLLPKPAQLENELLPAAEIRDEPPDVVVSDVAGLMMPPSDCPDRPDANLESSLPSLSRPKPVRLSRKHPSTHPHTHTPHS